MTEIKVIGKNGEIRSVLVAYKGISGAYHSKSGKTSYICDEKASAKACDAIYRKA